jgi:exodeoxyribonuclease VIII
MKQHFMVDLETMGVLPTSAIMSIGIVHFDEDRVLGQFYTPVSLESCMRHGLTVDPSTIEWWMKQSSAAKQALFQSPVELSQALIEMGKFLQQQGGLATDCLVWGNGSDFDNAILSHAYRVVGLPQPWGAFNNRCFRTMKNLYRGHEPTRAGVHHNALDDALHQVLWMQRIVQGNGLRLE